MRESETHPSSHLGDVGADEVAESCDLVGEADLGRQEGVRGVLRHLGRGQPGQQDGDGITPPAFARDVLLEDRAVQLDEHRERLAAVTSQHDAIGMQVVPYRVAFAEEFRVRDDVEEHPGRACAELFLEDRGEPEAGADRHGRLRDDGVVVAQVCSHTVCDRRHRRHVGLAVRARWSSDADEHDVGGSHRLGEVSGEAQRPGGQARLEELLQPRLVERDEPGEQGVELAFVGLDADDAVTDVREAGRDHRPDVPTADHRHAL